MADPTKYTPSYNFSNWQLTNPTKPLPAQRVDTEYANIANSIGQAINAIKDVRRSDGELANGSVGPDQLSAVLSIGFTLRGYWADGVKYSTGDGVVFDDKFYSARVEHTASDLTEPDVSPGTWSYLFSIADATIPPGSLNGDSLLTDFSVTERKLADVSVSTRTLVNSAATNEKLADMASGTIKGRATADTGNPEDLTAPDARKVMSVGSIVDSRAILKALDTSKDTVAFLKEPGREGQFIWRTGDYSAQIAADTQEGVFIKADAVAATVGAWVRDYKGPLQAAWFGAKATPGFDNILAISGALSLGFALSNFLDLEFQGGQFDFSTSLSTVMPNSAGWSTKSTTTVTIGTGTKTFTVAPGLSIVAGEPATAYRLGLTGTLRMSGTVVSYSGTTLVINVTSTEGSGDGSVWNIVRNYKNTAAFACLKIRGAGKGVTKINWPSGGGLKVRYRSQQHSIDIQGLSMTVGVQSGGTALELQNEYPFFGEFTSANYIDVDFHGSDGQHLTNYWTRAIDAADVSQIDFMSSRFGGASTPNGAGIRTRAVVGDFVCVFDMGKCQFRFLSTGYEYGHGSQTAQMIGTFFGMNITDVFGSGTNHQGLTIVGAECFKAADGDGVYLSTPVPNFVFSLNKWGVHAGKRAVVMEMADASTILANQFFPDVAGNTALAAVDIIACVPGSRTIIDHNKFDSVTVGARLFEGTSGVRFGEGNTCTAGMTADVQDFSTGNTTTAGYGIGSGGTVTQATSKTTAVTLNKPSGVITTSNAALAAGARVTFTVNCNRMKSTDTVMLLAGNGNYSAVANNPTNGSFTITLKNESGGSLSDAVALNYTIMKGSSV